MPSKLLTLLRALTVEQRADFAARCGTSPNYLYQVAGSEPANPRASLALAIEDASRLFNKRYGTPIVTVRDLVEIRNAR